MITKAASQPSRHAHRISDRTKIRDGVVANRPVYLAIGIDCDGAKQVLGLWVCPDHRGVGQVRLTVLTELNDRGVADVCFVCCDGLTGLPERSASPGPRRRCSSAWCT